MRIEGRKAEGGIHQGCRKKLAKAATWAFKPKDVAEKDEWLWKVAQAYPHLKWVANSAEEPPKPQPWHGFYWEAWRSLRYDRPFIGQFGIEMPIFYTAIDRYAERNGIEGESFDLLLRFVSVIDTAYLEQKEAERSAALAAAAPPTHPPAIENQNG